MSVFSHGLIPARRRRSLRVTFPNAGAALQKPASHADALSVGRLVLLSLTVVLLTACGGSKVSDSTPRQPALEAWSPEKVVRVFRSHGINLEVQEIGDEHTPFVLDDSGV